MSEYKPPTKISIANKITISSKQFDDLHYMGVKEVLISHPIVIKKMISKYTIYMRDYFAIKFFDMPRFDNTTWHKNREAGMVYVDIPIDHHLIKTINNYFSHLIMK